MKIHNHIHGLKTDEGIALYDLNEVIGNILSDSGIQDGMVLVSSRHTTTALTINEYEERLLDDIKQYFSKQVPADGDYLHNDIYLRDCPPDEPENAHSHIIAMLLSSSETIPVVKGNLQLGQWQSVILLELDGPRERKVTIQVMGE